MRYKIVFRSSTDPVEKKDVPDFSDDKMAHDDGDSLTEEEISRLLGDHHLDVSDPPPPSSSPYLASAIPLAEGETRLEDIRHAEMQMLKFREEFGAVEFSRMVSNVLKKNKTIRRISKESGSSNEKTKKDEGGTSGVNKVSSFEYEKNSDSTTSLPGSSEALTAIVDQTRPMNPTNIDSANSPVSDTVLPRFD